MTWDKDYEGSWFYGTGSKEKAPARPKWWAGLVGTKIEIPWSRDGKSGVDTVTVSAHGTLEDRWGNGWYVLPSEDPGDLLSWVLAQRAEEEEGEEE